MKQVNGARDFYGVLGVTISTEQVEVRKAYRKLSMLLHPDKNPSPEACEAFKKVGEAMTTLSDPAKRAQYNMRVPGSSSSSFQAPKGGMWKGMPPAPANFHAAAARQAAAATQAARAKAAAGKGKQKANMSLLLLLLRPLPLLLSLLLSPRHKRCRHQLQSQYRQMRFLFQQQ